MQQNRITLEHQVCWAPLSSNNLFHNGWDKFRFRSTKNGLLINLLWQSTVYISYQVFALEEYIASAYTILLSHSDSIKEVAPPNHSNLPLRFSLFSLIDCLVPLSVHFICIIKASQKLPNIKTYNLQLSRTKNVCTTVRTVNMESIENFLTEVSNVLQRFLLPVL